MEHVLGMCGGMSNIVKDMKVGEVLREDGGGRWRIMEIDKERKEKSKE